MAPKLTFPLFALFGLTRGLGGAGLGLLLADRIPHTKRKRLGIALFAAGAASTLPLLIAFIRRTRRAAEAADLDLDVEAAGVMDPQTEIYTPSMGVVDAQEADILPQTGAPNLRR